MSILDEIKAKAVTKAGEAMALPYAAYSSDEVYTLEQQKIFHGDWVFICNANVLKEPGDRFAMVLAGEPLVIIRGKDGSLRAMSNACSHRGTLLADEGVSNGSALVCPYHSWNYTDEGKLRGAPFTGDVKVDKEAHCLPQFAVTEWMGLVFVNIDGKAEPFEKRVEGLEEYLNLYQVETYKFGMEGEPEYWDSNWKLAMENAMESYHLFKVHEKTLETITPTKGAFYVEGGGPWAVTAGEQDASMSGLARFFKGEPTGVEKHYVLVSLPPSFVGIVTADGNFGYIAILPEGPNRSYIRAGGIYFQDYKPGKAEAKFVEDFFAEDKWICERAHRAMNTQHHRGGQLVELERIVVDFHHYLADKLFGVEPGARYKNPEADARLLKGLEDYA